MATNLATPDEPNRSTTNTFNLLSSAEITANRVNTILRVIDALSPKITQYEEYDPISTARSVDGRYDGGPKLAAEATFIKACNRLDHILDNELLWESQSIDQMLASKVEEIHQLQAATATQQLILARDINRPYRRFGAKLAMINRRTFVAFIGDLKDPNTILATGDNAEEAISNLDEILNATEQALNAKNTLSHE